MNVSPHAVAFTGINQTEFRKVSIPEPGDGEVLVETITTAVSPGTEFRCLAGLQPGAPPFPFIPGYAATGIVTGVGKNVKTPIGTHVAINGTSKASISLCWGGHVSHAVLNESNLLEIAADLNLEHTSLFKLVAITHRGYTVAKSTPEDKVVIIGLGPIGMLSAKWYITSNKHVLCLDQSPERVLIAQKAGLQAVQVTTDLRTVVLDHFRNGADIAVDCTGSSRVLEQSVSVIKNSNLNSNCETNGKLIIQGSYPGKVEIPYQEAFSRELEIHFPRDVQPLDKTIAIEAISSGKIDVSDLITFNETADRAPEFYKNAPSDPSQLTAVFNWKG